MSSLAEARSGRLPRSVRRAQLLAAAQEVFVESGYHSAAMDEIADRAHVSKPVLYQHFPGKLDLYLALLDQHTKEVPRLIRSAMESTTNNQERVAAAIHAFFAFISRDDGAFRLVFESDLTNDPLVARKVTRMTAECADAIARVVEEDTSLAHEESHTVATALVGMSQVVARDWLARGQRISRHAAAEIVVRMAWRGLTGFPMPTK